MNKRYPTTCALCGHRDSTQSTKLDGREVAACDWCTDGKTVGPLPFQQIAQRYSKYAPKNTAPVITDNDRDDDSNETEAA